MQLSQASQDLLDKAFSLRDVATAKDTTLSTDQDALAKLQQTVVDDTANSLQAHKDSSDGAHQALLAIAQELGFPLPTGF